ncbi:ATP-dependent DNA helicase RecG [Echinimonas agarilytica]|uniref:ATP-dependent DNA helicase RecG n=1 Tax=Echinimonas agarilytica TaxID=1215918 RepID=A0AA42B8L3_9GAMM|nr:ATP-dependent DNA helicase RecG [Echinimonas agarilytica]MCM2681007.1 ATP-dependent DNA helicase RecG [Echinimonas agarilytica]
MSTQTLAKLPLTHLKGVGKSLAEKLAKLHLNSVQDLLFHLPLRYEDRTRVFAIDSLLPGQTGTIFGEIVNADLRFGRRRTLIVQVRDGSGTITLRFFTFSAAQKQAFVAGRSIRCFGEAKRGPSGIEMVHPEYKVTEDSTADIDVEDSFTPVYPTTEGLRQASLRKLTDQALESLRRHPLPELLPDGLYQSQISLNEAVMLLHRPSAEVSQQTLLDGEHPAQQRLIIEELLAHNLSVQKVRLQSDTTQAVSLPQSSQLAPQFLAQLSFRPTGAQQRVVREIQTDLARPHPMMRLVQGDVGSGKTLVAALAALSALEQGYQVALMAPTELLAEQHAVNFAQWLQPLAIELVWLAGKTKGKQRQAALDSIASGSGQMVVGTHALFQDQVEFKNLALVIIDEQHRFGVHQRLTLREKGIAQGIAPHQLIMTATPIPRTLAMTAYADLDTSVIDELPPGRTPVGTVALPDTRRDLVIERIHSACTVDNRQAYWVCTLIEESDVLEAQAAEDAAAELKEALPSLRIGLVHGRMKPAEKKSIMDKFKLGELDLLVATTVIEVGVDIPNASLMVIENPERLGLAQLHQLRGRVGRGSVASHCVLLYKAPLSKTATKRLAVLRESNDGFLIAERDLEIRGPGEILGTRQTGLAELKIADLVRDQALIPLVQQLSGNIVQNYPSHVEPLIERWMGERVHFGNA